MSVEAISWAFSQPIKHSTAKFVLVAMANHADGDMMCWPSTAHLCQQTSQDRKTVLENMKRLREWGYLEDTGMRKGGTGSVPVYRLCSPKIGIASDEKTGSESGEAEPKTGQVSDTENGTPLSTSDTNLGTALEDEAVPFFPTSSPVFPMKQSRFSVEAVPKTGHGTIKEPSVNHQGTIKPTRKEKPTEPEEPIALPDWLPSEVWADWTEYRKSIKAKLSLKAAQLCLRTLEKLRSEGHDPKEVIEQSIMSGKWSGLYPLKAQAQTQHQAPAKQPQDAWWLNNAGIERKGRELGLFARNGEDYGSFKDRIFARLREGGKAA